MIRYFCDHCENEVKPMLNASNSLHKMAGYVNGIYVAVSLSRQEDVDLVLCFSCARAIMIAMFDNVSKTREEKYG